MKFRCGIRQAGGAPDTPNVQAASVLKAGIAWAALAQFTGEDCPKTPGVVDAEVEVITPSGKHYSVYVSGRVDLTARKVNYE